MRELTSDEVATLERRRARLEPFLAARMPTLADFAEALGLESPPLIVAEPTRYLPAVDAFMRDQVVELADREWILTRLGFFIGEVLVQRLGGCWLLNEQPDTRFFLRYVVGSFPRARHPSAMVDPFHVADTYLATGPGRSLTQLLAEVEAEARG